MPTSRNYRTHRHSPYDARYNELTRVNASHFLVIDFSDGGGERFAVATPRFREIAQRTLSLPFIHPGGIFKRRGEHLHDAGRQLV